MPRGNAKVTAAQARELIARGSTVPFPMVPSEYGTLSFEIFSIETIEIDGQEAEVFVGRMLIETTLQLNRGADNLVAQRCREALDKGQQLLIHLDSDLAMVLDFVPASADNSPT